MAKVRIPRQKVILCGDYGVGKSSLFRRFTNDTFVTATDRQSTLGLDHIEKVYEIQDKRIKVSFPLSLVFFVYAFAIIFIGKSLYAAAIMGHRRHGTCRVSHLLLL